MFRFGVVKVMAYGSAKNALVKVNRMKLAIQSESSKRIGMTYPG